MEISYFFTKDSYIILYIWKIIHPTLTLKKESGYNNLFHLEQILDECLREMECLDNSMVSKSEMSIGPEKAYSIK